MVMKISEGERGQILAMTVLAMTMLLGFVALAVDVGLLFREKRTAQIAADSAAIAAAMNYQYKGSSYATAAADAAAAANGFTNTADVVVTPSPTDGYHTGTGYIEVDIVHSTQTTLMGMFGFPTVTVGARAVAGTIGGPACMYVTDPTDSDTFYIKGKGTVTAPACGIQVNSTSLNATCNQGAAQVNAPYMHIVGGQDVGGPCKSTPKTPISTGVAPVGDPFDNFTGPTSTSQCTTNNVGMDASGNLTGTITGPGAGNTACYTFSTTSKGKTKPAAVNLSAATLGPGTYVFMSGVNLSGTVTVNSGTLDIEQGTFSQGNAQLSITAPASKSNPYNGIALMQPSTNTTASSCDTSAPCLQIQFGSGNENLNGIIYAPTSEVYMQDEGGGVQAAGLVAYQLYVNSSLDLTDSYNDANPGTTPLVKVALVE